MGTLEDRYREIVRRVDDPGPAAARAADVLRAGKREQLLAGVDAGGSPFAPLAPATLRRRRGSGPPLAPRGEASRIVAGYAVDVAVAPGRLEVTAGWPGLDWVGDHRTGTRRMPRRDPGGFRDADRARVLSLLSEYVRGPD